MLLVLVLFVGCENNSNSSNSSNSSSNSSNSSNSPTQLPPFIEEGGEYSIVGSDGSSRFYTVVEIRDEWLVVEGRHGGETRWIRIENIFMIVGP